MADQKIQVEITGDARDFIKASKDVQSELQDLGKSAKETAEELKAAADPGISSIRTETAKLSPEVKKSAAAFTEVRAAALTYFASLASSPMAGFAAALVGVSKAIDELSEAERAAAGLVAAFSTEKTNISLEKTRNLIDDLAARSAFFDDDAISAGAVVLKNLGATQDQLESLLPVATNFAGVYGMTVTQAAEKLAYGITGSTRSLRDFGILLKDDATAGERYAAILERNRKASSELTTVSSGVTAAVGRMNKAFGDAWQQLGNNFEPMLIGLITIVQKLAQTLGLIPTIIKIAADVLVGFSGMFVGAFAAIPETIMNAMNIKGLKFTGVTDFMKAWQSQILETIQKDMGNLKGQFQDLFTFDFQIPGIDMKVPGTKSGLIPEVKPGEAPAATGVQKTLADQARELAQTKNLYGLKPDVALGRAIGEVLGKALPGIIDRNTLKQGTAASDVVKALQAANIQPNPQLQELIGMLGELDFKPVAESINKLSSEQFTEIVDPIKRLETQLANIGTAKVLAGAMVTGAVTGEQRQAAEALASQMTDREKELRIQLAALQKNQNDQFISSLASTFSNFINSLADTLGRAAAGGAGVTGGQMTRAVGGLATGALAAGAALMPAGATLTAGGITAPAAGVLMVGGMIIGGLAGFFGGMMDQGDESNQHLKELVSLGREQKTDALKRMGLLDEPMAALAKGIQPLADQARDKGGALGSGMEAIIQRFGFGSVNDPQARAQLETIAKGIATGSGDWVGMVNANMGLGIELNKENRQMLENLFLTLFNLVGNFKDDETKRAAEAAQNELKQLGSMPRNPVYVYDVTPKEERFSFAPREAFFRASATRQVGTNVTPAYQMG